MGLSCESGVKALARLLSGRRCSRAEKASSEPLAIFVLASP
jgi:hypothetical protein